MALWQSYCVGNGGEKPGTITRSTSCVAHKCTQNQLCLAGHREHPASRFLARIPGGG